MFLILNKAYDLSLLDTKKKSIISLALAFGTKRKRGNINIQRNIPDVAFQLQVQCPFALAILAPISFVQYPSLAFEVLSLGPGI